MKIRSSNANDVASIAALFTESVHGIASRSYDPEQLAAWAPMPPSLEQWAARLEPLTTLVGEIDGEPAGFISFMSTGHIELLFTSPRHARQGVASGLYAEAKRALDAGRVEELTTDASLEARPFFERQGFRVIAVEVVERNGVRLRRFKMKLGSTADVAS